MKNTEQGEKDITVIGKRTDDYGLRPVLEAVDAGKSWIVCSLEEEQREN